MLSVIQSRSSMNGAPGGITVIELMIVIAIVAVFLSLAAPVYSGYKIRAKISECINNTATATFAISEYRRIHGEWPPTLQTAGLTQAAGTSRYCTAIDSYQKSTGAFTINVNEPAVDFDLVLVSPHMTPTLTQSNVIKWNCSAGETELDEIAFLPPGCRDN